MGARRGAGSTERSRPDGRGRLAGLVVALAAVAFVAPVGPGRALPASASVSPPACTNETIITAPYANCRFGYGGASFTLGPATLNPQNGYLEGRYRYTLPNLCPDCQGWGGGIYGSRTYVPGGPQAGAGAPSGVDFGMDQDDPTQTGPGTYQGVYRYHDPGGAEKAVFIRAQTYGRADGAATVTAAADAVLVVGTPLTPPNCATGTSVIGAAPRLATVRVTPCAGEPSYVTGYQALAYIGSSTTPIVVNAEGRYAEFTMDQNLPVGRPVRFTTRAKGPNAVGPETAKSAPAILPFTTVDGFTSQAFGDFAYRPPSAAEADAWRTALSNNTSSGQQLIAANVGTATWDVRAPVIRLFRAYFGRLPDLGGLDYWVGKSRAGTRLAAISSSFAASNEFKTKYGTLSNRAFVTRIYTDVLGRGADPSGTDYWTTKLDTKTKSRGEVMTGFSESSEYKNKTRALVDVVTVYAAMVRKIPTQAQLDTASSLPLVDLVTTVMADPAYDKRFNTVAWPAITTTSPLAGAVRSKPYSFALVHFGGPPPLTWKVLSGKLPDGLTLSAAGVIAGTPTKAGTFSFTVQLADVRTRPVSKSLQLTVT